jgi:hypothetical protein
VIAPRLLTRKEVAERLSVFGCQFIRDIVNPEDDYYAYSYWRTSWGFHFTVPLVGPDRLAPEYRVYDVLAEVAARKFQNDNPDDKSP